MQVEQFLEDSVEQSPDKIALICRVHRLTYAQLEERSNQLAHLLQQNGVSRWDRVVLYAPNSIEAAIAVFAILKAAGVFVVINPSTKRDKLVYILNNCRATALITTNSLLPVVQEATRETPFLRTIIVAGMEPEPVPFGIDKKRWLPLEEASCQLPTKRCGRKNIDLDLAALIYTSGSTGQPKGVMLSHSNIVSAATSITTYLENRSDDVIINVLPLAFDYGLYQLLMSCKAGGTLILEKSFAYPHAILETIVREHVTGFPIVPTMCSILLQMDLSAYSFPHLRYITNTAAALPVDHIRRLREAFPNVRIYSMYGLTECKRVSYLDPGQLDIRPGSVGRGMPNEEVYIVDEHNQKVPANVVGELVVRGAHVMKGYWELPEETDRVLKPGPFPNESVLYTGDLFRADDEGYLYFVGRKDDIIKTKGEKVSPREVENVLHTHPKVVEAAVIGVPDPTLGHAICAFVSLIAGAAVDERELLAFCADRLEDFMVPKFIKFAPALPKSSNGKIAKRELSFDRAPAAVGDLS